MDEITIRWDAPILNKLIGLTFKTNYNITTANLRNLQKLLNRSNMTPYQNKGMIIKRIKFLKAALRAKLDEQLEDEDIIINYCRPDTPDPIVDDIINSIPKYKQLNNREIQMLNNMVNDRLQYGVINSKIISLKEIIARIENGEFSTYAEAANWVDKWITDYKSTSREIQTKSAQGIIRFGDAKIKDRIRDVLKRLGTTSSIIITGIQMLNEMLSPGLRPEKLYVLLGLPGGFKSALLVKLFLDTIKYNAKTYRPKDPDCKPVALYITLENTNEESFARAWNMTCKADDIENYSVDEIYAGMKDYGIIGNPDMDGIMMYRPNMSIDTNNVREIIDQLKSEGFEVCALFLDYIGRIHSAQRAANEKEELKNVTNELKTIAIDYFIPVVTAHQGNRSGLAVANAAKREGKADIGKLMGAEFTGTAIEVLQNADMQLFLTIERRKSDGRLFLSFTRSKERYRPQTKLEYFSQPFEIGNEIKLVDDLMMDKPQGVVSIGDDMDGIDMDLLLGQNTKHNKYKSSKPSSMSKGNVTDDDFNMQPL